MIGFHRNSLAHSFGTDYKSSKTPGKLSLSPGKPTNKLAIHSASAAPGVVGVNNGEYTPLCMQPQPNESTYLAKGIEVAGSPQMVAVDR